MQPCWAVKEICARLARSPESWAAVRDGQSFVPLLALLEHPHSVVDAQLVEGLVAAGLPRSEVERVSLRDLVIFALTGQLKWGAHAVTWIEAGFSIDDEIVSALEQVAQDKRFPQRVRHRAFSVAKRWRRAHAAVVAPVR